MYTRYQVMCKLLFFTGKLPIYSFTVKVVERTSEDVYDEDVHFFR